MLGKQFFPFDQLTRFLRNVFVHQTSTRLMIHNTTIVDQMLFLQGRGISEIVFSLDTGKLVFVDTYLTTIHIRVDF